MTTGPSRIPDLSANDTSTWPGRGWGPEVVLRRPAKPPPAAPDAATVVAALTAAFADDEAGGGSGELMRAFLRTLLTPGLNGRVKRALGYVLFSADAMCRDGRGRLIDAGANAGSREPPGTPGGFRPFTEVGTAVRHSIGYLLPGTIRDPGGAEAARQARAAQARATRRGGRDRPA